MRYKLRFIPFTVFILMVLLFHNYLTPDGLEVDHILYQNISAAANPSAAATWQTISPNNSYIYSAFIDDRNVNRIFILAFIIAQLSGRNNIKLYCQIWYTNNARPVIVAGKVFLRQHSHDR